MIRRSVAVRAYGSAVGGQVVGGVAEQEARSLTEFGGGVARVPDAACGERQTAAPDALVELAAQQLEARDARLDVARELLGEPAPITFGRVASLGEAIELRLDLIE